MRQVQPQYKLLGNDASKDGKFATMEILKAMPIVSIARYGTVPTDSIVEACKEAPESEVAIPRRPDKTVDKAKLKQKLDADPAVAKTLGEKFSRLMAGRASATCPVVTL